MTKQVPDEDETLAREKLNRETAVIHWQELQPHFAAGNLLYIHPGLDLVEVAFQLSQDNTPIFKGWLDGNLVHPVRDEQAVAWQQQSFWAVVVKPWVLVQPAKRETGNF